MMITDGFVKKMVMRLDQIKLTIKSKSHRKDEVIKGIDIDLEHLYDDPQVAIDLQKRYMDTIKQVDLLKPKYKKQIDDITTLQRIEMLSVRAKQELEKLCQIYSETLVKKGEFKEKIKSRDEKKVEYLEQYEDQMDKIIKMMKEHEGNQRLVKQDLAYLEGEKTELLYQGKRLKKAFAFVKNAMIVVALLTALAGLVLSIMYFIYNQSIMLAAMIAMVAVIVATVWVYVFRRYLVHEISKNQKLMKRAIELTNKTKIKYINNQKVIDYQCGKYKIDSSEMLELRWDNYKDRINTEKQYKNISNSIAAMMTDIEDLLYKNGIKEADFVLDYMDYFASKRGRKILLTKFNEKKEDLYATLQKAEKESGLMNLVLTNYKSQMSYKKHS